jgi:hypothetical protein
VLATFELNWWVDRLRPILDQFIATAQGDPDLTFWQAIYKPFKAYGAEMITGWIADLFPYLGNTSTNTGASRRRSRVFRQKRTDWALTAAGGVSTRLDTETGVSLRAFPSGLASVPIKLILSSGPNPELHLDLVGGFLGVEQDSELSLSPVISWAVAEKAPAQPVLSL